jgi:hypothetical protein
MITKEQATEMIGGKFYRYTNFFHTSLQMADKKTPIRARRNGATQIWKSKKNINKFRIPIKIGFNSYSEITEKNAWEWEA